MQIRCQKKCWDLTAQKFSWVRLTNYFVQDAILTIASAMSNITPAVELENTESAPAYNFVMSRCSDPAFDYPVEFWDHVKVS